MKYEEGPGGGNPNPPIRSELAPSRACRTSRMPLGSSTLGYYGISMGDMEFACAELMSSDCKTSLNPAAAGVPDVIVPVYLNVDIFNTKRPSTMKCGEETSQVKKKYLRTTITEYAFGPQNFLERN